MPTIPSFIFGGNTGRASPGQIGQMRATAAALAARMQAPRDVPSGMHEVAKAIMARMSMDRAAEAEKQGRAEYEAKFTALGDTPDQAALLAAAPNGFETPGERAIWEARLASSMRGPDYQTHETNGDIYRWNAADPNSRPELFFDGPEPAGYRPLTPEEATAYGLEPGTAAQMGPDGKISAIGSGGTTVNVGEGSSAYNKKLDEQFAQRFIDMQREGQSAQSALNSFSVMEQSLSDPGFYSGAAGDMALNAKRFGQMLGFDVDGIDSMETFNAMSKKAALDSMGGSLGAGFSNADRDFVIDQVPNLGNTPEGNRKLIEIQRKLAQRRIETAQLATDYAKRNGQLDAGFDDELRRYAEQNPLFEVEPDKGGGSGQGANATGREITATNPETGETLVLRNGQWVKR